MRNASALWMSVQLMSLQGRIAAFVAALFGVALLLACVGWGANIGAHVGAKGWICGQGYKGSPYCRRDTTLRPDADVASIQPMEG